MDDDDEAGSDEPTKVGNLTPHAVKQMMMVDEERPVSAVYEIGGDPPTRVIPGSRRPVGTPDEESFADVVALAQVTRAFEHVPVTPMLLEDPPVAAPPPAEPVVEEPRPSRYRAVWICLAIAAFLAIAYGTTLALDRFVG